MHTTRGISPRYVYVSDDYGERWRSITDGLPQTSVNVLTEHPDQATSSPRQRGRVFVSLDGGDRWDPLMNGLPTVPVDGHPRKFRR